MNKTRFMIVFVAVAFLVLPAVSFAGHSWGNYHWGRTSNPFTLKTGDNVHTAWDAYLDEAIVDWNVSGKLDLLEVAGGSNPKNCRPTNGRIEVCASKYGNNGWLGLAQIWASGSHITQAITKLNDTYFNTAKYNTPAWRRMVTCQEIGHDFGLDHQDEAFDNTNLGTCMDYTNDPSGTAGTNGTLSNEHPNKHDYDQIDTIYAHLDGSNTYEQIFGATLGAFLMPPVLDSEVDDPSGWGRLVRVSDDGYTALFKRHLENGDVLLTFVIWADDDELDLIGDREHSRR